jgi:hypothetical protein
MRARRPQGTRPVLEALEDRMAPAILTVNSMADTANVSDGYLSLREAVAIVNSATLPSGLSAQIAGQMSGTLHGGGTDTIVFDHTKVTGPITLGDAQLELSLPSTAAIITIDGGTAGITLDGNNQSRIFEVDGSAQANLANLTITHGTSTNTGGGYTFFGGAILNFGTITVDNCTVSGNSAGCGGGIYNGGTAILSNCALFANSAAEGGGFFSANTATLLNCRLSDNTASIEGGGIECHSATVTLDNCTLSHNTAANGGGGIICYFTIIMDNCTLSDNFCGGIGGGIYNVNQVTLDLTNCTLCGNSASGIGGAVYNLGLATLADCTLSYNSALGGGGGVYNDSDTYSVGWMSLKNSIVANSQGGDIADNGNLGGSNNLVEDGSGLSGWLRGDPRLGLLHDNGGPTQTIALLPGSPAIDAGKNSLVPAGVTTDQRGGPRIVNGAADLGAFELEPAPLSSSPSDLTPPTATEGAAFGPVTVFHFSDANPNASASDYVATVQTGDATLSSTAKPSNVTVVADTANGGFNVLLSYTYVEELINATFSVSVTDATASTSQSTGTFSVADAALTNVLAVNSNTAVEGQASTVLLATFTDPAGPEPVGDYSADINWGDGTGNQPNSSTITYNSTTGSFQVWGTHTYAQAGSNPYLVTIQPHHESATDPAPVTARVTVQDVADRGLIVTTASDAVSHSGLSLRDAIAIANTDAAVGLSDTITFDQNLNGATITLTQGQLELTGGSGTTTIDGGGQIAISGNNASRVFDVAGGAQGVLTGLTIAKGKVLTDDGGGIYNEGTLTVSNSIFSGDSAGFGGGGIYNAGPLSVNNCVFSGNSAETGAGILADGSTLTVNNSNFSGNSAVYSGGGIYCANVRVATVSNCALMGNSAINGGGIFASVTMLTVSNSTLSGNSAAAGGGIENFVATLTVSNSTLAGNLARSGGGIYNDVGTLTVSNCTLTGNSANGTGGGGIFNFDATLTLTNSTLADNSASGQAAGGGIYNYDGGSALLNNSIVANSTSGGDLYLDSGNGSAFSGSNDLIGDGSNLSSFANSIQGNPLLGALADSGGPTQTMTLLPGSPAIDAGSNALAVDANGQPLQFDQRGPGFPRIVGKFADIGAFEVQVISPTVTLTAVDATSTGGPYAVTNLSTVITPAAASGSVSYVFYSDAGGLDAIATPTNAGTYYVQANFTSSDPAHFSNATSSIVPFTITAKSLSAQQGQPQVNAVERGDTNLVILARFTDPAGAEAVTNHSATVDWGDSTTPDNTTDANPNIFIVQAGSTFLVEGSHMYMDESPVGGYAITTTIHDETAPDTVVNTLRAFVSDPAVSATGGPSFTALAGQTTGTKTLATFTDPAGPEATTEYTAIVYWGDGSSADIITPTFSGGTFAVSGSHTYAEEGTYTVSVQIQHGTAPNVTVITSAAVADTPPTATLSNNGPVSAGSLATITFSGAYDPSSVDTAAGFHYSFAQDRNSLASSYAAAGTASSAQFTWPADGSYTVWGRVLDKDGGYTDYSTVVSVSTPTLTVNTGTLNLGVTAQGTAGAPQTYSISGSNLTANVVLTAPAGVELSADGINYHGSLTLTPSGGILANTSICLRVSASALAGSISCNITDTSTGAAERDVSVSGTVIGVPTVHVTDAGGTYSGKPFAVTAASVIGKDGTTIASFGSPLLSYLYFKGTTPLPGAPSAAGSYTVVAHFAGNAKQGSLYSAPVSFVIKPAAITFNIGNDIQTYGRPANLGHDLGTMLPTGINGEKLHITYNSIGDTAKAHVNTYAITATASNFTGRAANYEVTFNTGALTVTPYAFTFNIPSDNRLYASTINLALDLGTTINTRVNGENLHITYSSVGTAPNSAVGKYVITGAPSSGTGALADYTVTLHTGTLIIHPVGGN